MDRLSVYDAKAHFSELIERAESGRATVITKRGRVVARIVPAKEAEWDRAAVLDEAEALRKKLKVNRRFRSCASVWKRRKAWRTSRGASRKCAREASSRSFVPIAPSRERKALRRLASRLAAMTQTSEQGG